MSSHARHGSAPRPGAAPHPDARYAGARHVDASYDGVRHAGAGDEGPGYDGAGYAGAGYDGAGYDGAGYDGAGYAGAGHDSGYADDAYGAAYAEPAYEHGGYGRVHADGSYVAGSYDSPAAGSSTARSSAGRSFANGSSASGLGGYAYEAQEAQEAAQGAVSQRDVESQGAGVRAARPSRSQARAAARARARRKRLMRTSFLGVGSVAAVAVIAVAGFMSPHGSDHTGAQSDASAVPVAGRTGAGDASRSIDRATPAAVVRQLPGLGKSFLAKVPASAQQVLLVTGKGKGQNTGTAVLYTRTAGGGWMAGPTWAARNAKDGWTTDHHAGDLHSPIGVFGLTDAGGLDSNPGTKLPYTHSTAFQAPGTGFEGESLADAFDYVVAINYNHVPGTSPLSEQRPMGASRGGGIWVHVDHGGPTHGCVALAKQDMRALLQALDPAKHPVIVMGDAASLAQ